MEELYRNYKGIVKEFSRNYMKEFQKNYEEIVRGLSSSWVASGFRQSLEVPPGSHHSAPPVTVGASMITNFAVPRSMRLSKNWVPCLGVLTIRLIVLFWCLLWELDLWKLQNTITLKPRM